MAHVAAFLKTPVIDEVDSQAVNPDTASKLLDFFEHIMKKIEPLRVSQVAFELDDFETAKARGLGGYTLSIERVRIDVPEMHWRATFTRGTESLVTQGHLEVGE